MATGTSTSNARAMPAQPRLARGFTLLEMMVVVVIIGVVVAGMLLSLGVTGRDSELERERDRLDGLFSYVRERGELQTSEYGLRVTPASCSEPPASLSNSAAIFRPGAWSRSTTARRRSASFTRARPP